MAEPTASLPLTAEEIAQFEAKRVAEWDGDLAPRLLATIRHLQGVLEEIRTTPSKVTPAVSETGQLVIVVATPQDPRGEMILVSKATSLELGGTIFVRQGFVQVPPPAATAPTAPLEGAAPLERGLESDDGDRREAD